MFQLSKARVTRSVTAVGGVIAVACLITLTSPKTVHALAAALVQVTNTASNPVVTQSVGMQSTSMIHITCSNLVSDGSCSLAPSPSNTTQQGPFVVPNGQSLIVTAVDIYPNAPFWVSGCNAIHQDQLMPTGVVQAVTQSWVVYNTTLHMDYPTGIVFPSGTTIYQNVAVYPTGTQASCGTSRDLIDLYGYLTTS